ARLRGAGRPGRRGLAGALAAAAQRGLAGTARPGPPLGAGAPGAVDPPPHSRRLQGRWAAPAATAGGGGWDPPASAGAGQADVRSVNEVRASGRIPVAAPKARTHPQIPFGKFSRTPRPLFFAAGARAPADPPVTATPRLVPPSAVLRKRARRLAHHEISQLP